MVRSPEYCSTGDVADWLGVDINANTDPNTTMVENFIMDNEDIIDQETGHSWLTKRQFTEVFDVTDIYDYGRGMYLPIKHHDMKTWDESKGDLFEIWNGVEFVPQTVSEPDTFVNFETTKGTVHVRGYIYTIVRKGRFRFTYRYGGTREKVDGQLLPRDIKKACKLMTCIDILSRDFKMSQIAYGGEGNVDKASMIEKWEKQVKKIIWNHSDILTVY